MASARGSVAIFAIVVAALTAALFSPGAARAQTRPAPQPFRVYVMQHMTLAGLHRLENRGAVGLLVPGVGPDTNFRRALASLLRGRTENARLGGIPRGAPLINWSEATGKPSVGPSIILALPPRGAPASNDRRYPIVILGHGFHGLITSPTTRIPGLVSIIDIAPTALGRTRGSLSSTDAASAASYVVSLDKRIASNADLKMGAIVIVAVLVGALALFDLVAGLTGMVAALLGSLALGAAGVGSMPVLVVGLVVMTLAGGVVLARVCSSELRLLALIAGLLLCYLVAMVFEPTWFAVNPLGPTQNSRYFGIGNQVETFLLAPIVVGCALAGRRFGLPGFVLFAALSLVTVADNAFGADGGGAVVLGVALAVLGSRLARRGWLGIAVSLALGAVAVLAMILYDLRAGGPDHLRSAFDHGFGGLWAVARNRLPLAYEPAIHQWYMLVPFSLLFVSLAVATLRGHHPPGRRDLIAALVLAIGVSIVVNDSANWVLLGGAAALVALSRLPYAFVPMRQTQFGYSVVFERPPELAREADS